MAESRSIRRSVLRLLVRGRRLGRRLRGRRAGRRAMAAAGILAAAFAAGTWVIAPYLVAGAILRFEAAVPGRTAEVERVGVNPFTLTVFLEGVTWSEPALAAAAERIIVNFDLRALSVDAARIDALTVHRPRITFAAPAERGAPVVRVPSFPARIERLIVTDGRLEQRAAPTSGGWVLAGIALGGEQIGSDSGRFELDIADAAGGTLSASGEVDLGARSASGRLRGDGLDAERVGAWLTDGVGAGGTAALTASFDWTDGRLVLDDVTLRVSEPRFALAEADRIVAGALEGEGRIEVSADGLRASGRLAFDDVALLAGGGDMPWLSAEHFAGEGLSLRVAGAAGDIWFDSIGLRAPRLSLAFDDDVSEQSALGRSPLDAVRAALTAAEPPVAGEPSRPLRVGARRIGVDGGNVELVDARVDPPAAFRASEVDGVLERLAERPGWVAAELDGRFNDAGTVSVRVRADAAADSTERDVALEFRGVSAAAFSAYARRAFGVAVTSGSADARIEYRIEGGVLDGDAGLRAEALRVERGESPASESPASESPRDSEVSLAPEELDFALALLEDEARAVETRLPLAAAGAEVSIRDAVSDALRVRLRDAVDAPFAALGASIGVDGDRLASVAFPAGQAAPSAAGTSGLAALADALSERPRVRIVVPRFVEPDADRSALAVSQVELHVTLATAGPAGPAARPRPVDFDSPRHRDVLDEFAAERLDAEMRETIASYFTRAPSGEVVDAEKSDYYRALFDALVVNEQIPESGLERLGRFRAQSIADFLTRQGIAPARIEIAAELPPDAARASSAERPSSARLEPGTDVTVAVPLALAVRADTEGALADTAQLEPLEPAFSSAFSAPRSRELLVLTSMSP